MKENILIHQEIELPNEFDIKDFKLFYRDIDLLNLAKTYGTPLRFTYLPSIVEKIEMMQDCFQAAIAAAKYAGTYTYFYCTKSSHFRHILDKALQANIGIEISSAYDIDLIGSMIDKGTLQSGTSVICNGYKTPEYLDNIIRLIENKHCKVLPIVDSKSELLFYIEQLDNVKHLAIGIRLNLSFLSSYKNKSRFGLSPTEILHLYKEYIQQDSRIQLTTLHFFNESGISNRLAYWDTLEEIVRFYCLLKRSNPQLDTLDIGGGMPFRTTIAADHDISYWIQRIISTIQTICQEEGILEPNIITEFGKYTVAEATSTLFKLQDKKQHENHTWAIIDGSFITHLPDTWAIQQEYPVLAVNNLDSKQSPFILGGLTCDSADYYPNVPNQEVVMLPQSEKEQYIAFLHTGAYQEVLSGFGGINHCLIPYPKHIIIDKDRENSLSYTVFTDKQNSKQLLQLLGYL